MPSHGRAAFRHAQCFSDILLHADELYQLGADRVEEGLRVFDENRRNIEIAQKWAVALADTIEGAATLALEFPERGANCLYLRQRPEDRLVWFQKALQIAHARGFGWVEGSILGKIGLAFQELRQYSQAIEYYTARLQLAERLNDQGGWGETACNLGILYDELNMLEPAQEWYESALEMAKKTSNDRLTERTSGNLGLVHLKLDKFTEAMACFELHLQLARNHSDLWSEGNALTNLGITFLKLHHYEQAQNCFKESLLINKNLEDFDGAAKNWGYIGLLLNQVDELEGAVAAYQERIRLAQQLNDLRGEAIGRWNLGEVLIKQKKCEQGVELLYQCVEYEKSVGDPAWEDDWKAAQRMEEICHIQQS